MMTRDLLVSLAIGMSLVCVASTVQGAEPKEWIRGQLDDLVSIYRDFHAHPELSFQEQETGQRLAKHLRAAGLEVTENVGGFGIVGLLRNGAGPTVMLRSDLDALPVTEQTGLAFASQVKVQQEDGSEVGVMHACGHDVHITNLIGVARYLAGNRDRWSGTAMFIGQPAEERGSGAKAMLDDGLFQKFPKPDFALAVHVDAELATGRLGYRAGYALANVDSVDVILRGKGGHGAYPHKTIDPIVQAAQFILALQTIVSREIKPIDPAVITVGSIRAGSKHNIISDSCHLQLTVRSYTDEVRQQLLDSIHRKARGVAIAAGAPEPVIQVSEGTPAMFNDEELTARMLPILRGVVGEENVQQAEPSMGGEDFSQFGRAGVPILMFRLGAVDPARLQRFEELGQPAPSLHSPLFYPDIDDALQTGVPALATAALELLKAKP